MHAKAFADAAPLPGVDVQFLPPGSQPTAHLLQPGINLAIGVATRANLDPIRMRDPATQRTKMSVDVRGRPVDDAFAQPTPPKSSGCSRP